MTKEITKAFILQQIQDKFQLRELEPERFRFSEEVIPVYDIEQHLKTVEAIHETVSITGTGAAEIFRVPETEKWKLHRYFTVYGVGTFTTTGVFIGRPNATEFMYLDLKAGVSSSYLVDLPKSAALNPGDGLYVNVDNYTSTGNFQLFIDVTKEEIR